MLIDDNNPQTMQPKTALDKLATSTYTFYLSGSRFFGTNRPSSDWDYFVQMPMSEGYKLHDELRSFGFTKRYTTNYLDLNTLEVWSCDHVDVQIVANVPFKRAAQMAFKRCGKLYPSREDWDAAYVVAAELTQMNNKA